MKLPPERPISLAASFALIRAATYIVPAQQRGQFEYDWQQKLFHRWQFLRQTGLWNVREELKLLAGGLGAIPDAVQHFGAQDSVRAKVSRFIQSPFTCLGALSAMLLLIVLFSDGLPGTRDLLFKRLDAGGARLVYVWSHNLRGGGDRPLPSDVVEAWKKHSRIVSSAAAFRAVHRDVQLSDGPAERRLVIITEPSFFDVMGTQPVTGSVTSNAGKDDNLPGYVLLSYAAWMEQFHASPRVKGSRLAISGSTYPIVGVLPAGFEPLSRQPALYLVEPRFSEPDAFAVVRAHPGVSLKLLDQEFTEIAENVTYYFLNGQIRFGFAQAAVWTPVRSFSFGVLASVLLLLLVFRVKWRMLWPQAHSQTAFMRRATFFLVKTSIGLACVFSACLEWSRSRSAILFGNFDPATGPFLLWLYILGTMGVLFWTVVDQKARCRECLQLLAFPVRMGSPGNLLLDWSGIELCCSQGHGVLHVPHLAPSWAEESEHWIALDDSWQSIFGPDKRP